MLQKRGLDDLLEGVRWNLSSDSTIDVWPSRPLDRATKAEQVMGTGLRKVHAILPIPICLVMEVAAMQRGLGNQVYAATVAATRRCKQSSVEHNTMEISSP